MLLIRGRPRSAQPGDARPANGAAVREDGARGSWYSVSFDAAYGHARPPHLDEQAIAGVGEPGQYHLVELGSEQLTGRLVLQLADQNSPTSHFGFASPFGRIALVGQRWGCAGRIGDRGPDRRPFERPASSRTRARLRRTPPRCLRSGVTHQRAAWRSSCACQRRTGHEPRRQRRAPHARRRSTWPYREDARAERTVDPAVPDAPLARCPPRYSGTFGARSVLVAQQSGGPTPSPLKGACGRRRPDVEPSISRGGSAVVRQVVVAASVAVDTRR